MIGLRLMRDSIFQQRCDTNISVVWHLCRGRQLRRRILHRTMCTKRASRGWRRGNGFEPPSRVVHTRALPIELPCQSPSRLALRLGCFALRRGARTHYRGHRFRRLGFERISLGVVVLSHRNQSIRHLFGGGHHREAEADVGLSAEILGTRHCGIPCALPCNAQPFVRFLTDVNFFGGNVDPLGGGGAKGCVVGVWSTPQRSKGSATATRPTGRRSF